MAPKARAKVKAKAKAKGAPRPMRAMAKHAARAPPARRGGMALRRPGARVRGDPGPEDMAAKWMRGEEMLLRDVEVSKFMGGASVVVTEGHYYGSLVKLVGRITKVELEGSSVELKLMARGTTSEGLLRAHSAEPGTPLTVLVCPSDCGHVESGDRYVHGVKGYLLRAGQPEEEWMNNLVAAVVPPVDLEKDEMAELRRRGEGLGVGAPLEPPRSPGGPKDDAVEKEDKKADKKKKKKKRKEKKKKKAEKEESSSKIDKSQLDGRHPVTASQKRYQSLFSGTGLDMREKVRRRVSRKARKILSKKRGRSRSSSGSSTSSSSRSLSLESEEEGLFMEDNKAKGVGEKCPGALCQESLKAMRQGLLAGQGEDLGGASNRPIATMYFKQEVQKRASGPMAREMLNLSVALDHLIRGRPAQAADTIAQRLKSCETVLNGTHWSVAQKMELPISDHTSIAQHTELHHAHKETYYESRTSYLASLGPTVRRPEGKGKGPGGKNDKGKKGEKGHRGDKGGDGDWKEKDKEGKGAKKK